MASLFSGSLGTGDPRRRLIDLDQLSRRSITYSSSAITVRPLPATRFILVDTSSEAVSGSRLTAWSRTSAGMTDISCTDAG